MGMLHLGQEIRKVLKKRKIKVVDFARTINTDRNNVYDIYRRKSIDTDLLIKISDALNHDFFADISEALSMNNSVHYLNTGIGKLKTELNKQEIIQAYEKRLQQLEAHLRDKEEIIRLLKRKKA